MNDLAPAVKESYAIKDELRRGLKLSASSYRQDGKSFLDINIKYVTLDGRIHNLSQTTVEVK
jgi:hypothetical protein